MPSPSQTPRFQIIEHTIPCQSIREYHRAVRPNTPPSALRLAVKQYIPLREDPTPGPDDVTIIAGHANGIPKVASPVPDLQSFAVILLVSVTKHDFCFRR
jgi:hypothetical protein